MRIPTPAEIIALRTAAGLTQAQAAEAVHLGSRKRWSEYECGNQAMDAARWELFVIKCGKHADFLPLAAIPKHVKLAMRLEARAKAASAVIALD
jgi:transcriptional regulator with XRE-family HTH domain